MASSLGNSQGLIFLFQFSCMHWDPTKDKAVSLPVKLFITIYPFLKRYLNIYLLGFSEGKRLSRTPVSDNVSELCLSSSYKLKASFPGPTTSCTECVGPFPVGTQLSWEKSRQAMCTIKISISCLLLIPLVDFSSGDFSSCSLCANGERGKKTLLSTLSFKAAE